MKNTFNSYLWALILTLMSASGVVCPTHAVLMVDIDQCNQALTFHENTYKTVSVNKSIRVVTFNTDLEKIESIDYLLAPTNREVYKIKLKSCEIEYSFQQMPPSLTIYPAIEFRGIYRSFGKFDGMRESKSLQSWDHTRSHWQVFFQDTFPEKTIQEIDLHLNQFDHPSQKTNWKAPHRMGLKTCLYLGDKTDIQEVIEGQKGEIGEVACDLTMMANGCIKLDAKHTGNQGIDGLYEKNDSLIAAEVKYHKTPPPLESIMRNNLMSKFNLKNKGALVKINQDLCQKIREINHQEKLYFLPYGIHPNGQAYCYFKQDKFHDPDMEKLMEEISPFYTPEKIGSPALILTPQSSEKEKDDYLKNFLTNFMHISGTSPQRAHEMMTKILSGMEEAPLLPIVEAPVERILFLDGNIEEEITPPPTPHLVLTSGAVVYPTTITLKEYQNLFSLFQRKMDCGSFDSQMAMCLGGSVKKTHILNVRRGNTKVTDTMLQGIHTQFLNPEIRAQVEKLFLEPRGQ